VQGDARLFTQEVGGFSSASQRVVANVTTVAGGVQSGGSACAIRPASSTRPRGSNWQQLASGILVLAVQQGAPR
jgi:hypothetical protein